MYVSPRFFNPLFYEVLWSFIKVMMSSVSKTDIESDRKKGFYIHAYIHTCIVKDIFFELRQTKDYPRHTQELREKNIP